MSDEHIFFVKFTKGPKSIFSCLQVHAAFDAHINNIHSFLSLVDDDMHVKSSKIQTQDTHIHSIAKHFDIKSCVAKRFSKILNEPCQIITLNTQSMGNDKC